MCSSETALLLESQLLSRVRSALPATPQREHVTARTSCSRALRNLGVRHESSVINILIILCPLLPQCCRAEESQARPKDPLGSSLPDVGLEQWFEFREDQLQPLEPPLPQTAAQPHEV